MHKFSIGCDPEIFLQDAAGAMISVIGKIGGTKADPRPLRVLGDGFAVQEDNVALEFNIPPANDATEFLHHLDVTKKYLSAEVAELGLKFSEKSAEYFEPTQLMHPMAQVFGCDPDWDAWTRRRNVMPIDLDPRLRSAGGHVHVGYDRIPTLVSKFNLIKYMDLVLGVPSVLMDSGELRKELYGKAGACRTKDYGVEYRTLSNFWIFKEDLISWVYRGTQRAIEMYEGRVADMEDWQGPIKNAINNNNKEIAYSLVDHFKLEVVNA